MDGDAARDADLPYPMSNMPCFERADGAQAWIDASDPGHGNHGRRGRVVWLDRGEIDAIRPHGLKDEARAEAEYQAGEAALDVLQDAGAGVLDWLGDALGALLSP